MAGGRAGRQRERSFGDDLDEAENFALKVERDKRGTDLDQTGLPLASSVRSLNATRQ
jgi:hypothetical protein